MSEDPTQRLLTAFEQRIFARLDEMEARFNERMTVLENKVDRRLMETRPIWQAMQATLEDVHSEVTELGRELLATRGRVQRLEERHRPPAA